MTQTTNQMSGAAAKVEVSSNGSDWTDVSGHEQSVECSAQSRMIGTAYTHDGDTALITAGKREPIEVTVNLVYTEEAADGFDFVRTEFETDAGDAIYVRWSPAGGSGGDYQYSTGAAEVSEFEYPSADASSPDPIMVAFTVTTAAITQSAVAT